MPPIRRATAQPWQAACCRAVLCTLLRSPSTQALRHFWPLPVVQEVAAAPASQVLLTDMLFLLRDALDLVLELDPAPVPAWAASYGYQPGLAATGPYDYYYPSVAAVDEEDYLEGPEDFGELLLLPGRAIARRLQQAGGAGAGDAAAAPLAPAGDVPVPPSEEDEVLDTDYDDIGSYDEPAFDYYG